MIVMNHQVEMLVRSTHLNRRLCQFGGYLSALIYWTRCASLCLLFPLVYVYVLLVTAYLIPILPVSSEKALSDSVTTTSGTGSNASALFTKLFVVSLFSLLI